MICMSPSSFAADLQLYGPEARLPKPLSPTQSRQYCQRLARRHYENFTVVSWLLPRRLRQHFYPIYAYCRWADDLADETSGPGESLTLLQWWEDLLHQCYRGRATHPVFVALADTIAEFEIPMTLLADLLVAFRQDQQVTRYETFEQLLEYCRYSANPVGRLVLCLGRCHDAKRGELADSICTGLQLANFWQDVARDWQRGRIYLPQDHLKRFGCDPASFPQKPASQPFRELLRAEVAEAERWLLRGRPLVAMMPQALMFDVALFVEGGLAILAAIRRQDYDVWSSRPVLSKADKFGLAVRCWWQLRRGVYPGNRA